jgi:hypothetical protein
MGLRENTITRALRSRWLRSYGPALTVYLVAALSTGAFFMADTADYVDSIVARERGFDYEFWDFGHLLWRPGGWLAFRALRPLAALAVGPDARAEVTWTLIALSWVAGAACVLLMHSLALRLSGRSARVAAVTTLAFVFAQGFLNYVHAGCAYVPGLAFLLLSLRLALGGEESGGRGWPRAVWVGLAAALAVCTWLPYVLAVPGVLSAPLFVRGAERREWMTSLRAGLVFGAATGAAYAAVCARLGIFTVAQLSAWIAASSHGNDVKGLTRAVFGLARSFVNMGNDGTLFKRYLLHDPFNPVSLWALLSLSLWKLALFYLFLAALAVSALRDEESRRVLGVALYGSIPVFAFAVLFDGGAVERYLPLYPFVFLALAACLRSRRAHTALKCLALLFVAVSFLTNVSAMSARSLSRKQAEAAARIAGVQPRLAPHSLVYAANWQDDIVNFSRSFPFHSLNRGGQLHVDALVTPGTTQAGTWREDFAARSLAAWREGGDVWVSNRVLSARPRADWNWVEGDDPRVSWPDFADFFSRLESDESVGGEDGFMRLARTDPNETFLRSLGDVPGARAAGE